MNLTPLSRVNLPVRLPLRHRRKGIDGTSFLLKAALPMGNTENSDLVTNSVLYKEFLAEREEILKHKWLESEKVGHDIGFEKALLDWIVKYRSAWRDKRQKHVSTG